MKITFIIDKTDNANVALNFCLYKIKFVFNNVQHIFPSNIDLIKN